MTLFEVVKQLIVPLFGFKVNLGSFVIPFEQKVAFQR